MSKQCSCCFSSSRKIKKGLWSPQEDEKLRDYITNKGAKSWTLVPLEAGLDRCGKSCRLRWLNYLRPDIKRGEFSLQEQQLIFQLQSAYGNRYNCRWSWIAKFIPGRTDNEIKNFWNARRPCKDGGVDSSSYISPYRLAAPFLLENCINVDESETKSPLQAKHEEENAPQATSCRDMEPKNECMDDMLFYDVVLQDFMDLDHMFQQVP